MNIVTELFQLTRLVEQSGAKYWSDFVRTAVFKSQNHQEDRDGETIGVAQFKRINWLSSSHFLGMLLWETEKDKFRETPHAGTTITASFRERHLLSKINRIFMKDDRCHRQTTDDVASSISKDNQTPQNCLRFIVGFVL
ncbi:unnamed protein product [Caenorhabditis brenneri]